MRGLDLSEKLRLCSPQLLPEQGGQVVGEEGRVFPSSARVGVGRQQRRVGEAPRYHRLRPWLGRALGGSERPSEGLALRDSVAEHSIELVAVAADHAAESAKAPEAANCRHSC